MSLMSLIDVSQKKSHFVQPKFVQIHETTSSLIFALNSAAAAH